MGQQQQQLGLLERQQLGFLGRQPQQQQLGRLGRQPQQVPPWGRQLPQPPNAIIQQAGNFGCCSPVNPTGLCGQLELLGQLVFLGQQQQQLGLLEWQQQQLVFLGRQPQQQQLVFMGQQPQQGRLG
jgi:hypothetical protein